MQDNDQWLTDGDCTRCRRQKYCSKPCKKHQYRTQTEMTHAIIKAVTHAMFGKNDK